jgi:hypothetical protein|tara:strand:- start:4235 stop:4732 length:498 start_codon:yes stop_codon:yes gene_type:complete
MYKDRIEPVFELPVPGMGLTHEVGARPWQTPAKYKTVDEVAQFYLGQMRNDTFSDQVTSLLQTKMPVTMIANSMNTVNIMEGVHSIDVGMMTMPIIMETIMLIADQQGIDYVTGTEQDYEAQVLDTDVESASQKIEEGEAIQTPDEQIIEEKTSDMPMGLMARRN